MGRQARVAHTRPSFAEGSALNYYAPLGVISHIRSRCQPSLNVLVVLH